MLSNVVALVYDGVGSFGLGTVSEVFGDDRSADGLPRFDFAIAAEKPGVVRTDSGIRIIAEHGLERTETADLVCVLGWESRLIADGGDAEPPEAIVAALRAVVARGGRILSLCTGAFVVAASGLLDGRRAATHWMHAAELARRHPQVTVEADVLYVDDGPVLSSAGTAAGIDASLYLLRCEFGAAVASEFARRMVVPPHREGGQAQFITAPVPKIDEDSRVGDTLTWAQSNLEQDISVTALAARAMMSSRSFSRHFRATIGSTPHAWLLGQRIARAQELLERTTLPIDEVARQAGLGAATTLRHHFARRLGTSPQAYRRAFS